MSIWTDFRELFFPRLCLVCGKKLYLSEDLICFSCLSSLPYTRDLGVPGNEMEMLFWGRFPIERAFALYYYAHGGSVSRILASMKYLGRKDVCFKMGMLLAGRLSDVGFFDKADFLVPVPLHPKRYHKRGYNQSEWLAKGIGEVAGKPVLADALCRLRNNRTQTRKSAFERWINTENLFALAPGSNLLKGKHVVLVDDVLTTGATIEACADVLSEIEGIRISVVTLAWTK